MFTSFCLFITVVFHDSWNYKQLLSEDSCSWGLGATGWLSFCDGFV